MKSMKSILIFSLTLFLTFINVNAQATDVVTGLNNKPAGLVFNGNDLYIAEPDGGKILKIDVTVTSPTATDVVTGLNKPVELILNGNDLYIAENGGNKISKIDITATSPTATDVVTGLNEPTGLSLNVNDLYIAESGGNKISKINITATSPTATDVVTGLNTPHGIALNGNELYIAENGGNKISKIDITATSPTAKDVITGLDKPNRLVFSKNVMYISQKDKILKFTINTWTGNTDTDWSKATNWSSGEVPNFTNNITIPNTSNKPVIGTSTEVLVNSINVESNASLNIANGGSIIVNGNATGSITYNLAVDDKWHLISSPVTGLSYGDTWNTANSITPGTIGKNMGISYYDNNTGDWSYFQKGATDTPFNSGQGYAMKRTNAGNYKFTGGILNIDGSRDLTIANKDTPNENKWNLIGNTHPSYVSVYSFITNNTTQIDDARQAIYVFDVNSGNYKALTDGYIRPGQAFFINAKSSATKMTIDKGILSHQTGVNFYKNSNPKIASNPKVTLILSNGATKVNTEINYLEGKTTGLDPRFDLGTFTAVSSKLSVYSHLISDGKGINFMRQVLPQDYENLVVPIGVKAEANKEISFTVEALNLPLGIKVFLEDKATGTYMRLDKSGTDYKINPKKALNGVGRFFIHTKQSVLNVADDKVLSDNINVSVNDYILTITGLSSGKPSIKLFDLLGNELIDNSFIANGINEIHIPKIAMGIYIVHLETEAGKFTKKIIVK